MMFGWVCGRGGQGGRMAGTEQEGTGQHRAGVGHGQEKAWAPKGRAGQDGGGKADEADGAGQHVQCYTAQGRAGAGQEQGRGAGVVSLPAPLLVADAAFFIPLWVDPGPQRLVCRFASLVVPFFGLLSFFVSSLF